MNKKAYEIAVEHLQKTNPTMWDGKGRHPAEFKSGIMTYAINQYIDLDISFELEEDGWNHYCELRDHDSGDLLDALHGYGIDSPQNLSDTIEDV